MFPFAPWPQTTRLSSSSSKSIASAISVAPRVRQITAESQIPAQGILSRLSDSGDSIEIGEQLDLIMVRAQNVSFEGVIILCRGHSRIGIRCFVT